jgi:GT2 family glycosyltransferase
VPVFRGAAFLDDCLDALLATAPGIDVLVVDDGSDDDSACIAARRARRSEGRVRILPLARNRGFAGAVRCGVDLLLAEDDPPSVLVFVNQDCVVGEGWLAPLVAALEDPSVAVAGARLLDADGITLQHAGARIAANGLTSHIGRGSRDGAAFRQTADVDYVCGALMALRSRTWRLLGGFDERFAPAYYEEVDLCLRAAARGLRSVYVSGSNARHAEASVAGAGSAAYLAMYHRSRMRLVARHLFGLRWLGAELAWLGSLRSWAQARPALAAYRQLPSLLAERRAEVGVAS